MIFAIAVSLSDAIAENRTNSPSPSSRRDVVSRRFSRISVLSSFGSDLLLRPVETRSHRSTCDAE